MVINTHFSIETTRPTIATRDFGQFNCLLHLPHLFVHIFFYGVVVGDVDLVQVYGIIDVSPHVMIIVHMFNKSLQEEVWQYTTKTFSLHCHNGHTLLESLSKSWLGKPQMKQVLFMSCSALNCKEMIMMVIIMHRDTVCTPISYLGISEFRKSVHNYTKHNVQANGCDNDEECDVIEEADSCIISTSGLKFLIFTVHSTYANRLCYYTE